MGPWPCSADAPPPRRAPRAVCGGDGRTGSASRAHADHQDWRQARRSPAKRVTIQAFGHRVPDNLPRQARAEGAQPEGAKREVVGPRIRSDRGAKKAAPATRPRNQEVESQRQAQRESSKPRPMRGRGRGRGGHPARSGQTSPRSSTCHPRARRSGHRARADIGQGPDLPARPAVDESGAAKARSAAR